MKLNKNYIIIGAIVLVVIIAGYFYATRDQSPDATLVATTATTTVDSDLLSALRELRKLHLDDTIFTSQAWLSLTDFGKTLAPMASGRPNPFAPLDASVLASTTPLSNPGR